MKKNTFFIITMLIIGSLWITSCDPKSTNNNGEDGEDTTKTTNNVEESDVETFYLVPSPKDIFGFTDDKSLVFNSELINPTENVENYIDNKRKQLNFGIYAADLAYVAAYEKGNETVKYLDVVRNLSNKIGIGDVFNESLTKRIQNLTSNKDSLIVVSTDTYFDVIRYLEKKEKISTLALIATGGWIESLYIVVNLTTFEERSKSIQAIADQKIVFFNLMMYLEQNQSDPNIQDVLEQLAPIKSIYEELEVVNMESHPKTDDNEKIVIGGSAKISISEDQFNKLKQTISKIRNNFTGNSVP